MVIMTISHRSYLYDKLQIYKTTHLSPVPLCLRTTSNALSRLYLRISLYCSHFPVSLVFAFICNLEGHGAFVIYLFSPFLLPLLVLSLTKLFYSALLHLVIQTQQDFFHK